MSLGFDAISALPFATTQTAVDVNIQVVKNTLTINIGNPAISADSITEVPDPNRLTLGLGTITISADANVSPTGSQVVIKYKFTCWFSQHKCRYYTFCKPIDLGYRKCYNNC
ncbi:MAG: hypothetical protein CM15mV129_100 [uncultured marine virus]|nr:MAG: hypothetical protein CM15mV129_100 [uncultured marine virus]